ncbi:MAG: hypothetical protein H7831_11370 [Magnetococcus sp. WYHC-3]
MKAKVLEDGTLLLTDLHGNPIPNGQHSEAIRRNMPAILDMLEQRATDLNEWLSKMLLPHWTTPDPREASAPFQPAPFLLAKPEQPEVEEVGKIAAWFGEKERAESRYQEKMATFQSALAEWRAEEANHRYRQEELRKQYLSLSSGDERAMLQRFEDRLAKITWPRETIVTFQGNVKSVWVDIDLPEIEDMPQEIAKVLRRYMKVVWIPKSNIDVRRDYMAHIHSIGFRVAGEAFAAMPDLERIVVSGYSQRQCRDTGQVKNEYLYSVGIDRTKWMGINFSDLCAIDPIQAFERFDLRRNLSKTAHFSPISPFTS